MKLLFAYFSATGNTKKIADTMVKRFKEIGSKVENLDITLPEARQPEMDLSIFDAAVFGSPIHSMRAPRLVREWLDSLDGAGMKCATFFTWGLPGSPHSLRHPGEAAPSRFYGGGFG